MSHVGGKWGRMCRLCLCNSSDCVSILDENSEDEDSDLQGAIKSCVGVEVTKEDGLTCMICRKCRKLVIRFSTFKEACQESQKMLERLGKMYRDKAGRGNAEAEKSAGEKQKKGKKTPRMSEVWRHYTVCAEDKRYAKCSYCGSRISRGGKSMTTTALKKHLKQHGKSKPAINSAVASKESDSLRPLAMWTLSEGCLRAATIHNEETIISDQLEDHWSREGPSDSRDAEKETITSVKTEEGVAEEVDNSVREENVEGRWEEEEAMAGDEDSQVAMKLVTSTLSPDCYLLSVPDASIPVPMEGLALLQQEQVEHAMNGTNEFALILGGDEVADGTQVELLCHERLEDNEEESQDGNATKRPRKQRMVTREDPFEELVLSKSKEQGEHDHNYVRPSSGDNETDVLDSDQEEIEMSEEEATETTAEASASNEGEQEDEECSIVASIAKEDKEKNVDVVDLSSDDDEKEKREEAPPVPQMTTFEVTKKAGKNKILLKPMKNIRLLRLPALGSSTTSDNRNTVTRMQIDSRSGSLIASQQNVNAVGRVLNLSGGIRKKILLRGNAETLRHIPMVQGQLLNRSMPMTSILKLRKITR